MTTSKLVRNSWFGAKEVLSAAVGVGLRHKALSLVAFVVGLAVLHTTMAHPGSTRLLRSMRSRTYTVTATAYEAVANQTDSKPFITADNSRIPRGYGSRTHWLALSRDLLRPWGGPFEFGDKVRVRGVSRRFDGVYTVHDTMNRRYRHRLDLLVHPRERISLFQPGVKLQLLTQPSVSKPLRPSLRKSSPTASRRKPTKAISHLRHQGLRKPVAAAKKQGRATARHKKQSTKKVLS